MRPADRLDVEALANALPAAFGIDLAEPPDRGRHLALVGREEAGLAVDYQLGPTSPM